MTILDVLRKRLRDQMNTVTDEVALGAAKDFAEYMHMTGVIQGLAYAERALLDLQSDPDEDAE